MTDDIQTESTRYELPLAPIGSSDEEQRHNVEGTPASEETLAANALWFCRLRWVIIAMLAGFGVFTLLGKLPANLGLRPGAIWAFVCAGILVVCNVAYLIHLRHIANSPKRHAAQANLWMQIVLDLLVLTGVVHFIGSLETHMADVYLFHIVLSCIFFTPRQSSIVTLLACVLFLLCVLAELTGVIPASQLHINTGVRKSIEASRGEVLMVLGSVWGILIAVWYLASHFAAKLRQHEHDLAETNIRLVAAQKERTRHMMHTAHELKTPCAAIYANARVLIDGYCGDLPDEALGVLQRIAHRCLGLASQIQDMLRLANLRSEGGPISKPETFNVAEPLQWCIEQVLPAAGQRNVTLETDIRPVLTNCVEDHLKMFFLNLVSNAVNYSHEGGRVHVTCNLGADKRPHVTVSDEGIGIAQEKLPHIFEEYYRTTDAAQHNRGSSGLGLAIVQQIAQEHRIALTVESRPGKGTLFHAILPPEDTATIQAITKETHNGQHTGS
ncbi:MAG: HAMP domain-containing sensor histidine kinase [Phycisphaerae bacterium]|jgi:signal transduction histidine kinase|nr:HAMP domain-containing sensor histidine kinase [Phycisphaerae bacterium]